MNMYSECMQICIKATHETAMAKNFMCTGLNIMFGKDQNDLFRNSFCVCRDLNDKYITLFSFRYILQLRPSSIVMKYFSKQRLTNTCRNTNMKIVSMSKSDIINKNLYLDSFYLSNFFKAVLPEIRRLPALLSALGVDSPSMTCEAQLNRVCRKCHVL